jgi:hypothetical protein
MSPVVARAGEDGAVTAPAPPQTPKPAGPSLRVSIVLIIAGVALAIPTFIAGVVPIVEAVRSPIRFEVPGRSTMHLERGDYMVYEDKGPSSIGNAFSQDDSVTISPQDVSVTAPDGTAVDVLERGSTTETVSVGGRRYVGAVRFTTPEAGEYVVGVTDTAVGHALVAHPLASVARRSLGWFALAGLGGLLLILGVVLLIVGAVRRGRAYVPAFAVSPPGWYQDPSGSARWRYWDGTRWTEHVQ